MLELKLHTNTLPEKILKNLVPIAKVYELFYLSFPAVLFYGVLLFFKDLRKARNMIFTIRPRLFNWIF